MKTLKTMLAGVALVCACVAANATVKKVANNLTQNDVVSTYINDISSNKTTDLDKLLDNSLQFNLQRGQNVNTLNKTDLIKYMGSSVAAQPVSTNTTIIQQDDNVARVKVVFNYDGYTRTDVVTLNKSFGWKIVNIDSTYS